LKRDLTLEVWTNEGIIPNYAFPEKGGPFEGSVIDLVENISTTTNTIFRPSAQAIRELAPMNHFYTDKRSFPIKYLQMARNESDL
jgi:DEAD/DEAH box helicase domain-containing protein